MLLLTLWGKILDCPLNFGRTDSQRTSSLLLLCCFIKMFLDFACFLWCSTPLVTLFRIMFRYELLKKRIIVTIWLGISILRSQKDTRCRMPWDGRFRNTFLIWAFKIKYVTIKYELDYLSINISSTCASMLSI